MMQDPDYAGDVPIAVEQATDPHVKIGVDYWRSLCGGRRFPARADLTLRGMAAFLAYTVIVNVIEGGADYEYRFAGDAQNRTFKIPLKGIRISQIEAALPQLGATLRGVYDRARSPAAPFVMRGRLPSESFDSDPRYHETAFLPLGESDPAVDHLLLVGVNVPKPFWDIPITGSALSRNNWLFNLSYRERRLRDGARLRHTAGIAERFGSIAFIEYGGNLSANRMHSSVWCGR